MIVTIVEIYVKKEHINEFITAILDNRQNSVKEKGNLRFDVLQSLDDPSRFTLYEAYENKEAVKAHKNTPHYLKWRENVEEFMLSPRKGIPHKVIAPSEKSLW